jgi:hypothetical protein
MSIEAQDEEVLQDAYVKRCVEKGNEELVMKTSAKMHEH